MMPSPSMSTEQISLGDVHKLLLSRFNLDELQTLCVQLGVPWEHLSGDTLPAKARNLVEFMERRRRFEELAAKAAEFASESGARPENITPVRRLTLYDEL